MQNSCSVYGTYPKSTRGDWLKIEEYRWRVPRRGSRQKLAACVARREFCVLAKKALRTQTHKTGVYMHGPGIVRLEVGQMPAGNARQMYHYLGLTVAMQLESVNRDPHHVTPTRLSWRQPREWGVKKRSGEGGERRLKLKKKRDAHATKQDRGTSAKKEKENKSNVERDSNRDQTGDEDGNNNNNNEARGRESAKGSLPSTLLFPPSFFRRSSCSFLFTSRGEGVPCFVPLGALWTVTKRIFRTQKQLFRGRNLNLNGHFFLLFCFSFQVNFRELRSGMIYTRGSVFHYRIN